MVRKNEEAGSLAHYLTVAQAADVLGLSSSTLRDWDGSGKLKAARHAVNAYRLYRRQDLERLLAQVRSKR